MIPATSRPHLHAFLLAVFTLPALTHAASSARYIRVENPTATYMEWQEIEVFSGGTNIVKNHENFISGNHWMDAAMPRCSPAMLDGITDPMKRGTGYANGLGNKIDAWFEIDLGKSTNIDSIKLYAGGYPKRQFEDKGNRVITLLDENRCVVWASKWDYFDSKTPPAIENGVFSFIPESMTGGVIGMKIPPAGDSVEWMPLTWLLALEKETLPTDAAQRLTDFEARDTAKLPEFADRFFDLIEPDVTELVEARNLHYQGKDAQALDAWKKYLFTKISKLELASVTEGGSVDGSHKGIADDLVNGVRLDLSGTTARLVPITPGRIDWLNPAMGKENKYVEKFPRGLLEAYNATGDAKYVKRWAEIMDDWSLHFFSDTDTSNPNIKNLFVFCEVDSWMGLLGKLNEYAKARPQLIDLIPAPTLARMQLACLEQYGPAYWRPTRDMLFGHATSAIALWRKSLASFDEFGPGRRIALEWRQHLERWMTMCTEPDGLMVANSDEPHMIIPFQLAATLAVYEKNPPDWYTVGVRNRSLEWLDNAHRDIFRHPAPGGYDHRYGSTKVSWDRFVDMTIPYGKDGFDRSKEIYAIPEVRRILSSLCEVGKGRPAAAADAPKWQKQLVERKQKMYDAAVAILGNEKPEKPQINSDWMPYGGSYYFRSGWDDHDAFVSMHSRSSLGAMMANSCGQIVHYDYFFPLSRGDAIKINGLDRLANTKFPRHWTKHAQVDMRADPTPAEYRWHSSKLFDLGETEFTGRFQNDENGASIPNVNQTRQVMQLRDSRLFIITDKTAFLSPEESQRAHTFSIGFTPILSTLKDGPHPFNPAQLKCVDAEKKINTANPDGPNETLYQFSPSPLTYSSSVGALAETYPTRFFGAYAFAEAKVNAQWSTPGNSVLITLMSSSDAGAKERISKIVEMSNGTNVSGFDASLQDGGEIWYQAAVGNATTLTCGTFKATAKSLLVHLKENDGATFTGLALDCSTLELNGKRLNLPAADVEFTVTNGQLETAQSIYRPIDPVRFSPEINTFTDKQTVTLSSSTENIEIRYTTDGTIPTTTSKLYNGAFTITETSEIAARAYRLVDGKRMKFDGFEVNGTRFSEPTFGWFYKKPLEKALIVSDANSLVPGLSCEYLEGTWNTLYSNAHWMKPIASQVIEKLDFSTPYNPNYYYGTRYKGYLKIPADGVYTFHAPFEYTTMTCSASYDYRVYIDGKEWDLTQWFHGHGTWSVALNAGYHSFELDFANARVRPWRHAGLWVYGDYPSAWVEHEGPPSPLLVSGPGLEKQPLPNAWLYRRNPDAKLAGLIIGSSDAKTIAAVFDGKTETCFNSPDSTATWAGLDLGNAFRITRIRFHPGAGMEAGMGAGLFQGANDPSYTSPVTLYTLTETPASDWTEVGITNTQSFQYVRFLSSGKARTSLAELEFYGIPAFTLAAPTGLTATLTDTKINLSWTCNSENQTGFKIERAIAGYPYVQIATVDAKAVSYQQTSGLNPNTTYLYRVRAFTADGDSAYSSEAAVTTRGN